MGLGVLHGHLAAAVFVGAEVKVVHCPAAELVGAWVLKGKRGKRGKEEEEDKGGGVYLSGLIRRRRAAGASDTDCKQRHSLDAVPRPPCRAWC